MQQQVQQEDKKILVNIEKEQKERKVVLGFVEFFPTAE
jgi:hypothetical protein